MKSNRLNYVIVGTFVLAVIAGLVVTVALLTGRTGATDDYYTVYENVTGVEFGTRVLYEGYPIGQVEDVKPYTDDLGRLRFRINLSVVRGWHIPTDSIANIAAAGLLAKVTISIDAGKSADNLKPGDRIPSAETSNVIDAMSSLAVDLRKLTASDVKPLLANLNKVAASAAEILDKQGMDLVADLRRTLSDISDRAPGVFDNVDEITKKLNSSADRIGELLNRDNIAEAEAILSDLSQASGNLAQLTEDMAETRKTADALINRLNNVVIDNQLDVDRSIVDIRQSVESVARHIDAINQNLEGAARNMFEFSRQIRQNPGLLLGGKPPTDEAVK